jgi:hypothetical protein
MDPFPMGHHKVLIVGGPSWMGPSWSPVLLQPAQQHCRIRMETNADLCLGACKMADTRSRFTQG